MIRINSWKDKIFIHRAVELFALFICLAIVILYSVPPWRAYFFTGLADHWDPRLMGEWMAWNAHNILQGHFLLPNYNANFFYPHAYTLAFGELLWPQSFIYAAFYALSHNLFLSFNATMLIFWAISGPAMYLLLRELGLTRGVCYLGAFIFCLMPYRMRYYVEFNMVLVFIIPLLILLWIRWLKQPNIVNALWFIAGFWIAATSCLYFTIMAVIMLGFIFFAYLINHGNLVHQRDFRLSMIVIATGVTLITVVFLYPYVLLRLNGGYTRTAADYLKHHAQAMQYLDTRCAALLNSIFSVPRSRGAETYLFPGTVLGILTLSFLTTRLTTFIGQIRSACRSDIFLGVTKMVLWSFFWLTVVIHAFYGKVGWLTPFDHGLYAISFAIIVFYVLEIILKRSPDKNQNFRSGMAAAAVFCFFISLGPLITIGPDSIRLDIARGPFADISTWIPLFGAVRGLTRFSIVILVYLIVAGCTVLNKFVQNNYRLIWLFPALIGLLIFDASMMRYKYNDYTDVMESKIIHDVDSLPKESVLFQMPAAERTIDATIAMATIATCPLLINGDSGFVPSYFQKFYYWEKRGWQLNQITNWLSQIWPPVYMIVDKNAEKWLATGWHKPFPQKTLEKDWKLMDEDAAYALYSQRQKTTTNSPVIRHVRTDILKKYPIFYFSARLSTINQAVTAHILLNSQEIDSEAITSHWHTYHVLLPKKDMGRLTGEEIVLQVADTDAHPPTWEIKGVHFAATK